MKRQAILLLLSFLCSILYSYAQTLERIEFDVYHDGRKLVSPLAGGLDSPQFSAVDLNNDGRQDLYVFDKARDKGMTFLNTSSSGPAAYEYRPEYEEGFPELHHWVLLRDYDNDGVVDIFAYTNVSSVAGIDVYKGYYENGKIRFRQLPTSEGVHNILYVQQSNGSFTQAYVTKFDYPAIDDIDGDGDMDIVTFSQNGGYIYLYENMSMQRGFGRDSFKFERTDVCFGQLFESGVTACVTLSSRADSCSSGFTGPGGVRHAGSTLLTFDVDNDGDKELVLGDLSFNSLTYTLNGGTADNAWMVRQDCSFPSYDTPVEITSFPASFMLDIDGDGIRDLMAAPNETVARGDNYECSWFYKNVGSNEFPDFEFRQTDFLVEDMIDVGSGSVPALVDYNADGLLDIVIGNESMYDDDRPWNPSLWLYENTGTKTNPRFILVDDDWLGMNSLVGDNNYNLAPTFGDLDGDGDLDILIGEEAGTLFYGENIAGPGNFMQFNPLQYNYMKLDQGRLSTPSIVDVNRDGLLDLVVGDSRGNCNYYQNIGTVTAPMFDSIPTSDRLGQAIIGAIGFANGNSAPQFLEQDGALMMFSGSVEGGIYVYDNIDGNVDGRFDLVTKSYGDIFTGLDSRIAFGDLNGDDRLDIVVGNRSGGISVYGSSLATSLEEVWGGAEFELFPNPATELLNVRLPQAGRGQAVVYDLLGRPLQTRSFNGQQLEIPLQNFSSGIYILTIELPEENRSQKFVVK
ncbi:MAG: T9SS type A sorting domain-containing protein [Bacteroidota bacterium]